MAADKPTLSVEATPESDVVQSLAVEVPPNKVKRAFDRAYQELAKQVQVKGFRPGKAPRSVLERLYGDSLAEQIEHTLVAETLGDAVEQVGLEPVSEPAIEAGTPEPGEAFRYTARVEVKPQIELPETKGLPASRPKVEVKDADIDAELTNLRERSATLLEEPEETAAANGHTVGVDFVGRVDGKPFPGGSGQGVDVELGAGRMVPGFEDQLLGAKSGEDREITVTFPEDYGHADLAGKQAVFAAHVVAIKRREIPELDDEFAKDLGDFESLDALRERIRADLFAQRERASRAELHRTLMDSLLERARFEVPHGLVERQLAQQLQSAHQRLEGQIPHEALHQQLERWKEEWRERADRQVRESLLLEAVSRAEGLVVTPEEIEARIDQMAGEQGTDAAQLKKAWGGEDLDRTLEGQLLDEKALEFLGAQAKVEETSDT